MAMAGAVVGLVTWLMASQIYDLASRLPDDQFNIQTKIRTLAKPGGGIMGKASRILHELSRDIENRKTAEETRVAPPGPKPIPVEVHQPEPTAPQLLQNLLSPGNPPHYGRHCDRLCGVYASEQGGFA